MLKKIFKFLRRLVLMFLLIYSYNLYISPLDLLVPLNIITILYVGIFGIPAFISIIFLNFIMY